MPDALELSISELAANDLEEISRYSTERWGEDQTLRYVEELYEGQRASNKTLERSLHAEQA